MNCHFGCERDGIWTPLIMCRKTPKSNPLRSRMFELGVCDLHKDKSSIKNFLSDEGWTKIEKFLRENGHQGYKQGCTYLDWELKPEVPRFNEYEGSAF